MRQHDCILGNAELLVEPKDLTNPATAGQFRILDARSREQYLAGHIPGAVSAPFAENLDPDSRFKSADELRRRYQALGAENGAVFYCGSGVNATHHLLAMEIAGLPGARLYAGAWSDWSRRDAPVATGSEP